MKLSLHHPITYTKEISFQETSCASSFNMLFGLFDTLPVGADGCIRCEAIMTDEICIVNSLSGYYDPLEEEKVAGSIPAGKYVFQQLPVSPATGEALMPLLNRFAFSLDYDSDLKATFFIRLYKEGPFTTAIQFLAPIHTTEE